MEIILIMWKIDKRASFVTETTMFNGDRFNVVAFSNKMIGLLPFLGNIKTEDKKKKKL